jgi:signal transduction histidine kinase
VTSEEAVAPAASRFLRRISTRVMALSTLLVFASLLIAAAVLVELYRDGIERRFDALLSSHLFSLVAATSLSADGRLVGLPQIGEPRYQQPDTGWAWEVVPAGQGVSGRLASPFLDGTLEGPPVAALGFDEAFERRFEATIGDQFAKVVETEVALGGETQIARFRVAGDLGEIDAETEEFQGIVLVALGTVGTIMLAVNAAAIFLGLRPLDAARLQLTRVRKGEADQLAGPFASEIEPLAMEINALIDNNRRIVDRARVQVGDLAHALKTPLAVIANEQQGTGKKEALVREQADIMRKQIDHYLQRARMAAQAGTIAYRTEAGPVVERLVRVFAKLNPAIRFDLDIPNTPVIFAGEAQDLEEILGNLLENASKWGRNTIGVTLALQPDQRQFRLHVRDDGPGIAAEKREEALKRGRRLDEAKPGTGLGLAIVVELVREYRGTFELTDAPEGGLEARVVLPCAAH